MPKSALAAAVDAFGTACIVPVTNNGLNPLNGPRLVPISPTMRVLPVLVNAPIEVNKAKQPVLPTVGIKGPFKTALPQPSGADAFAPVTVTAPTIERALPSNWAPDPKIIAPLTIKFPTKEAPVAMVVRPSTFQKTLQALAPFTSNILALAAIENAPFNFITKTAFGFPSPSKVKFPIKEDGPAT